VTPARASKTAAQVALSRAIEARRTAADRVCFDPLAERLLDARYRVLLAWPLRAAVVRLIESRFAGHHHYVLTRTRHIDDFLADRLAPGVAQLVVLGAGYDSRAYRFGDRLSGVAVFEVDHPATSRRKVAAVANIFGAPPAHVTYVPIDFDRERLDAKLAQAGYRSAVRTLFLWEGTTPYLTAQAVDDTLRFVRTTSAPGSAVVFDYILQSVLDGTCTMRGALRERDRMRSTSEPFVFGIAERDITDYLGARGFTDVHDIGGEQLAARYLRGRDAYVKPWWRIAHATVA
jgi:methyltransferase (TIGR00027 family)